METVDNYLILIYEFIIVQDLQLVPYYYFLFPHLNEWLNEYNVAFRPPITVSLWPGFGQYIINESLHSLFDKDLIPQVVAEKNKNNNLQHRLHSLTITEFKTTSIFLTTWIHYNMNTMKNYNNNCNFINEYK